MSRRRWDELQARWARGERLSASEENERLAYASQDAVAQRELQLFAELRERASSEGAELSPTLMDRVLDVVQSRPRLRLVTSSEPGAEASFDERRRGLLHPARLAVAALLGAAAVGLALFAFSSAPPRPAVQAKLAGQQPPPQPARAELVLAAGDVLVDGRRVENGQSRLREGYRVKTGDGRACLTIDPGIDVCFSRNSDVQVQSLTDRNVQLRIDSGTALASLSRRPPGTSFSLVMGDVSASARGTTFAARQEDGQREVVVLEGIVDVLHGSDRRARVDAHSRVLIRSSAASFDSTPVERSEETRLLALRSSHELWTGASVGTLELFAAQTGALRVSIDHHAPLPLPLQGLVPAGRRRLTWQDAAGVVTSSWIDVAAGKTQRAAAPSPIGGAASSDEPTAKPSLAALLESARREVGRSKPGDALAVYDRLRAAYPSSAEAHTVLVTMGKLELGLGRQERALRHFNAYLRHGGALAPEALAGRIRALRALGRHADERAAITQYLASHPSGLEAPLFEKRLKELGRP